MLRIIYAIKATEYKSYMTTAVIQRRHAKLHLDRYFLQLMISSSCFLAGTTSVSESMFSRILLSLLLRPVAFFCQD